MPHESRIHRAGVASVEFAIAAPVALLFFFAAIEFSRMNMVHHTLDIAAYEGARAGITPGSTAEDVEDRVRAVLASVAVRQAEITVTPAVFQRNTREVTVEIQTPFGANSWIVPQFLSGVDLEATSTLAREGFTSIPN